MYLLDIVREMSKHAPTHMACQRDKYPNTFNQCDGCRAGMPLDEHNHHHQGATK